MNGPGWTKGLPVLLLGCVALVGASAYASDGATDPVDMGQWSKVETWPISATHTHLLPTGKVFFFGEFDEGKRSFLWDPSTDALTEIPEHLSYNPFCSGHSFLANGDLLVTGGHIALHVGVQYASLFDPFTLTWTRVPDMNTKRWYPTNTTLANGDVVVLSGEIDGPGVIDELPQVYLPSTHQWRNLTSAKIYLPYYPRDFLAPNGWIFVAGPATMTRLLDTQGTGAWFDVGPMETGTRTYGSAVMYEPGKVLIMGGADPPTDTAEVIDLNQPHPKWQYTAPMSSARRQLNATLLPNGRVLVTGGSSGPTFNNRDFPVLSAEVWDPDTGTWTPWASMANYHGYHSTSLLLPDGRVLMAGGRNNHTEQVYSPPYLFQGTRPVIDDAPKGFLPGETFTVKTHGADDVASVTLLRLGSVTHAFNMEQRFNRLPFTASDGVLTVTAPEDNRLAPPGYYLLFVIDTSGVPSVARIVHLGEGPTVEHAVHFTDAWKYDDRGVDLGTAWIPPGYDDSAWPSGPAPLGYDAGDEATVLRQSSAADPDADIPTYYFRKTFTVEGAVTAARLRVLFDDGVAVWINGHEVFSKNMDDGLGFSALASASVSNEIVDTDLSLESNPFVEGDNTIAAMVKQVSEHSPDLSFALGLTLSEEIPDAPPPTDAGTPSPDGGTVDTPPTNQGPGTRPSAPPPPPGGSGVDPTTAGCAAAGVGGGLWLLFFGLPLLFRKRRKPRAD